MTFHEDIFITDATFFFHGFSVLHFPLEVVGSTGGSVGGSTGGSAGGSIGGSGSSGISIGGSGSKASVGTSIPERVNSSHW